MTAITIDMERAVSAIHEYVARSVAPLSVRLAALETAQTKAVKPRMRLTPLEDAIQKWGMTPRPGETLEGVDGRRWRLDSIDGGQCRWVET